MVSLNDLRSKREEILSLAEKHGAHNIRVFGSVIRGENTPDSDIDFLVNMKPDASLLDRIGLINDLEDMFQSKVDVVNEKALHHTVKDIIIKQGVPL